uniref:semaphorin-3C-like isoform X1 n=2 Tax=Styela clava TaxID=7725 RepID=UPI001939E7FE|nr:semaphorin-3C-like isoform X1 [Styela clava]
MGSHHTTILLCAFVGCLYYSFCQGINIPKSTTLYENENGDENSDKMVVHGENAFVGGTNYFVILNLNKTSTENSRKITFNSTSRNYGFCKQFSADFHCENTVRILEVTSQGELLVCGTNAKKPKCYYYNIENSTFKETRMDAKSWFSDSPTSQTRSLVMGKENSTEDEFYVASTPSVSKEGIFSKRIPESLSTNRGWFNGPEFKGVYTVPNKNNVYLFLNEKSTNFVGGTFNAENTKNDFYSMVGRVCKNDQGGSWNKNIWMTFSKVRLICPWPGYAITDDENLYYNELVSTFQIKSSIFGMFRTSRNWGLPTYALAEYDTDVIDDVMEGKIFENNKTKYFHKTNPNNEISFEPSGDTPFLPGQCPTTLPYQLKSAFEKFVLENILIKTNVAPKGGKPFYVGNADHKYKFMFIHSTEWSKTILLLSENGYLKKIVRHSDMTTSDIFERRVYQGDDVIMTAELVEEKGYILAVTTSKVMSLPIQFCSLNIDCETCNSDPECEWKGDDEDLNFSCYVAKNKKQRTCPISPDTPRNLSAQLGKDDVRITWNQNDITAHIFNIITIKVEKTKKIVFSQKTLKNKMIIKRSTLQDGCIYQVEARSVNDTVISKEIKRNFTTDLQRPEVTLLRGENNIGISWSNVPGAVKYLVRLIKYNGEISQEILFLPTKKNNIFYFSNIDDSETYTVTVRAISQDEIESTGSVDYVRASSGQVSTPTLSSSDCTAVTLALTIFVALFLISLIVILHNVWIIKPRVNELKNDIDGCSYKRQYLLLWSKKHERTHLKCDDAVMSTTSA